MAYQRTLKPNSSSFFLFGPRGTGKSTWLRDCFKPDLNLDLLKSEMFLELSSNPEKIRSYIEALPKGSKVVVDEIQRVPDLLNEIHSLIFNYEDQYQFALTGSSSRKLRKENINLLAGRAITRRFFTLTSFELGEDFNLENILQFGTLPRVFNLKSKEDKIEYLSSYVESYLTEEIQREAIVRNLNAYTRFLKHAAILNGQHCNLNYISREAAVARSTLDGYFSILIDTLLGDFIESIHLKAKVKEVATPKFYFFDCGVVRALRQDLRHPIGPERGFLLENLILNEIRAASSYFSLAFEIHYWGVPSGNEVDFIISDGRRKIGIEIKASKNWKSEFSKGLNVLLAEKKIDRAIGIYSGNENLKNNKIEIYPVEKFLKILWNKQL